MVSFLLLVGLVVAEDPSTKPMRSPLELIENGAQDIWRKVEPKNTLYLELPQGRVIIELASDFAPAHIKNIKALAKEKYWDGLAILRVQDNYVVQWGDPYAEKPERKKIKSAKLTLPPEFDQSLDERIPFAPLPDSDTYAPVVGFSQGFAVAKDPTQKKMWMVHCYGAVGVGRNAPADSGGGAELYVVIGHSPRHLDRNVTLVGRVLKGMELLSALPRGTGKLGFYEKSEERIKILALRLASDVPERERTPLEVFRTDSKMFETLLEARRNRSEEWFHHKAGRLEVCNMPILVRPAKK